MRQIVVVAGVVLAAGTLLARYADQNVSSQPNSPPTAMAASSAPADTAARTVIIPRDNRGHFAVNAQVDGRRLAFLVDTGASVIALTEGDAMRLGLHPMPQEFTAVVKTANGTVRAARTQLNSVEIDDITVHNVDALIVPDSSLSENLLGLSFLSRLHRFEYSEGRLVLEQ
ncbi:MAG TPA: TIGR02281 family clan AA aspartic protease [Xanthobacteraceae bacterium]|nr:TIGR02281 family clan AA aspartic protease [Xanthobacteraceae bacterium]